MRLAAIACALIAGVVACNKAPAPVVADQPLAVLVSGCASLAREPGRDAPVCTVAADRKVRILVPSEAADRVEIQPVSPSKVVSGGRLYTVTVPAGAQVIAVTRIDAEGGRASASVVLAAKGRPAWFVEAQALRQKGDLDGAEARARAAGASDEDRAMAEGLLARVAMRRGKIDDAERHFRAAIELDKRTGHISDRADDAFALVFLLHQRSRRYVEARRVLDEVAPDLGLYPDGRAREPLYRAQVAWEAGDTRTALRELAVAMERAERLGAETIARAARQVRGMVMCNAGSAQSCVAALREAARELEHAEGVTPCERAELAISLDYAELEAAADPKTGASEARRLGTSSASKGLCPDVYLRALEMEHAALVEVRGGRAWSAGERLAEARAGTPEPRLSDALFWLDLEGKIAALNGKTNAALAAFEAERAQAAAAQRHGEVWRALVGRGRVLEGASRAREALEAYRAAEDVLDEAVVTVPFGEGRSSVTSESRESAQRAATILLAQRSDAAALDVVRRARSRLVRSLARRERVATLTGRERERWEQAVAEYRGAREELDAEASGDWKKARPALDAATDARKARHAKLRAALDDAMALVGGSRASALPAMSESELVLAYADLGGSAGVVGFAVEGGTVRAFAASAGVGAGAGDAGARDALLAPVTKEIERATRIRVLMEDALSGVDVHALTWNGMPLVAHAPVVYGLDLGAAPERSGRGALVVSDPTGDLPSAREEGRAALAVLAKRYDVRALSGRDATAARVREALGGAALLHYAGHGVFAGREGSESALPLALGGALTVADVLALPSAPERVILSGCEAGRQLGARDEGAAGLASAFLVAGAAEVVAPVRIVDDRAASALARDLHAAPDAGSSPDLASALQQAQVRAFREGRAGWESFRAFAR